MCWSRMEEKRKKNECIHWTIWPDVDDSRRYIGFESEPVVQYYMPAVLGQTQSWRIIMERFRPQKSYENTNLGDLACFRHRQDG